MELLYKAQKYMNAEGAVLAKKNERKKEER